MTLPAWLLFCLILALAMALIYQIGTGRFGWRLAAYWLLALAGVVAAEVLVESLGWNITRVGDLRLAPDLLGGAAVLAVLWLMGL